MILGKMKLLSTVVGAVALIASPVLARTVHNEAAPANQARHQAYQQACEASAVVGPDGKLVGAAPNASIHSQMQQYGLPE